MFWPSYGTQYALQSYTRYAIYHSPGRRRFGLPMKVSTPLSWYHSYFEVYLRSGTIEYSTVTTKITATSLRTLLFNYKMSFCVQIQLRVLRYSMYTIKIGGYFTVFHEICNIYCCFVLKFALVLDYTLDVPTTLSYCVDLRFRVTYTAELNLKF